MNTAKYFWKITRDHIEENTRLPISGPSNGNPELRTNPARFSMWDDDGNCYYSGMIYGEYDGFEPLDDFGTPDSGCTAIKINGQWL